MPEPYRHPKKRWWLLATLLRPLELLPPLGYGRPLLTRLAIPMPGLREEINILQLSDLHIDPRRTAGQPPWWRLLDGLRPDLIVFTGDYAYNYRAQRGPAVKIMGLLAHNFASVPAVAVRGNSDHPDILAELAAEAGVRTLCNQGFLYKKGSARLWVAGVDDPHHLRDDPQAALDGCPDDVPALLLAHSPDVLRHQAVREVQLVLTGHTHGGQVRLPFIGPLFTKTRCGRKYDVGLKKLEDTIIYINRGLGGLPVRFACPPEVAFFTLRPPEGNPMPEKRV